MKKFFYLFLLIIPCFAILLSGCGKSKLSYYYLTLPEQTTMYTVIVNTEDGDGVTTSPDSNGVEKANVLQNKNKITITVVINEGWQFADTFNVKIGTTELDGDILEEENKFVSEKYTLTSSQTLSINGVEVATNDVSISDLDFASYNFQINGQDLTSPTIRIPYTSDLILNMSQKEDVLKPVPDYLFIREGENGQELVALADEYNRPLYEDGSKDFKLSYANSYQNAEISISDNELNTHWYKLYNIAWNQLFEVKKVDESGADIGDLFWDTVQNMSTVYFKIFHKTPQGDFGYGITGLDDAQLKVNGKVLTAGANGVFTVENITTDLYLSVAGISLIEKAETTTYISKVVNNTIEHIVFLEGDTQFNPYADSYNTQCITTNTKIQLPKNKGITISSMNGTMQFIKESEDDTHEIYTITNIEADTIIFTKKMSVEITEDTAISENYTIDYKTSIDGEFSEFSSNIEVNYGDMLIMKLTPVSGAELPAGIYPKIINADTEKAFSLFGGYARYYPSSPEVMPAINSTTGDIIIGEDGSLLYIIASVTNDHLLMFAPQT